VTRRGTSFVRRSLEPTRRSTQKRPRNGCRSISNRRIEHAILHLLYARFYEKAMIDIGFAPELPREPFKRQFSQGMIRLSGSKMSSPRAISSRREYSRPSEPMTAPVPSLRRPAADDIDWTTDRRHHRRCGRFLDRLYRLSQYHESLPRRRRRRRRRGPTRRTSNDREGHPRPRALGQQQRSRR